MMPAGDPRPLTVLAADIGGTNASFAACRITADGAVRLGAVFRLATHLPGVCSFPSFWAAMRAAAPPELADTNAFDAVALAVAGSVDQHGASALLPNIAWNIRPGDIPGSIPVLLVNDFVAQGHALAAAAATGLAEVRGGPEPEGAIALVGAGTGLGHCAVVPLARDSGADRPWQVLGSEAGHAPFPFHGAEERAIEERLLRLADRPWLSNDDVVSGPGAVRLHQALGGAAAGPRDALAPAQHETVTWFARFYGRACRNFCLNVYPVRRLVVSGGVAIRNPHLVRSAAFQQEFDDAGDYRELLARIPIWLNTDPDLGLLGAAAYAAHRLRRS